MLCDRLICRLLVSSPPKCLPIWSARSRDRLIPLRLLPTSQHRPLLTFSTDHSPPVPPPIDPAPGPANANTIDLFLEHGLPQLTVPLPSRNEPCLFTLKPVTHSVGDLIDMLRSEDKGIDRAIVRSKETGVRIAASTSVQTLIKKPFELVINDTKYLVQPPLSGEDVVTTADEDSGRLGDVRSLVGELYEALNVEEHQAAQEKRLVQQLEALRDELAPLEAQKELLVQQAEKRTNQLTWLGLGMMSVQFGILARLTWWEYSWDIMEPVTYFVTYGTAMACYAYFVLTKQDYILPDVRDRQFLISFHKKAKKEFWDVERYNEIKDGIQNLEADLRRLRDPLKLKLPSSITKNNINGLGDGDKGILGTQINIGNFKSMLKGKLNS